jgi:hypothetical protein
MNSRHLRWALATLAALAPAATFAATAQAAGSASATCRGTDKLCEAKFSLAGGASNKRLTIRLPDTDLKLLAVNAVPAYVHQAYSLSGGHFALGGSEFIVTLNAVDYMPRGATLRFFFGVPASGLKCGNRPLAFLTIHTLGAPSMGAFSCAQARAVAAAWLAAFNAHRSVSSLTVNGIRYGCKLVPTLPQNQQCDGGATRVKFSSPTGG